MISVITCTHNPCKEFLNRVAEALQEQTLPIAQWEWIIVDNRSNPPVGSSLEVDWHPSARIVLEDELGLTPARLRGIKEAVHPLLVFVDDDNVLDANYLESAEAILEKHSNLGAVGGSTEGEFAGEVPKWFRRRELEMLGIRPISEDVWGNQKGNWNICPIGAGIVLRSEVAKEYARQLTSDSNRRSLDRKGDSLVSGGDVDMAHAAIELGYGMGRFAALRLTHLIPKERLSLGYLKQLAQGIGYSYRYLTLLNSASKVDAPARWFMRVTWLRPWVVRFRKPTPNKQIDESFLIGENRALIEWQQKNAG